MGDAHEMTVLVTVPVPGSSIRGIALRARHGRGPRACAVARSGGHPAIARCKPAQRPDGRLVIGACAPVPEDDVLDPDEEARMAKGDKGDKRSTKPKGKGIRGAIGGLVDKALHRDRDGSKAAAKAARKRDRQAAKHERKAAKAEKSAKAKGAA
jgi:hypothetical protein